MRKGRLAVLKPDISCLRRFLNICLRIESRGVIVPSKFLFGSSGWISSGQMMLKVGMNLVMIVVKTFFPFIQNLMLFLPLFGNGLT